MPASASVFAHAADDRLAVRAGSGAMEGVGEFAAAGEHAEDLARRARRRLRSFPAPARRRLRPSRSRRGSSRTAWTRLGADRSGSTAPTAAKTGPALPALTEPSVATHKRGVRLAAADGFDAELDRGGAGRAGGRQRNRRSLGAECIGEMVATEPNRKRR